MTGWREDFFKALRASRVVLMVVGICVISVALVGGGVVLITHRQALAQSSPPTLHFAQLPWALNSSWTYQTGPHNAAHDPDPYNGLDFVDQGNRSVRAVDDGTIYSLHLTGTACGTAACANDAIYVIEKVHINGLDVLVEYWHLAQVARADGGSWHVGDTVHANDQLGIEGGTGFSIPAGFVHLWLGLIYTNSQPIPMNAGTISFNNWAISGDSCSGQATRDGATAYAVNDNYYGCGHSYTNHSLLNGSGSGGGTPGPSPSSTPTQPPSLHDGSHWISNSSPVTIQPGQQFSVQFTFQNSGTTTWDGQYTLVCDTFYHPDTNCMGAGPVGLGGQNVAPGQQHTFTIQLTAPASVGQYNTSWAIAKDGSIFGDNNASVAVTVSQSLPPDNASFDGQSQYPTVNPGQQFSIYFVLTNTGSNTWSDGSSYALACTANCMGAGNVGFGGQNVSTGQQFQFNITLTAPNVGGTYQTTWILQHSGQSFGPSMWIDVTVPGTDNAQFIGQSAYPTLNEGQQLSVYFVEQNTGSTIWNDAGGYQLICVSTCLGAGAVGFGGQNISPSQQFQFNFTITAPGQAGSYQTTWRLAHNGNQFGPDMWLVVTVPAQWNSWFAQTRPFCDGMTPWNGDVNKSATDDCSSSSGLVLSQYGSHFAELDLDSPNGNGNYSMNQFRVEVQAGLLNPGDTSVMAALLVQTPQDPSQHGGYVLAVNSQGNWQLQQINGNGGISTIASGNVGINPGQFTLQIAVQNNQLTAYINGQQLTPIGDTLDPQPGAVSLMEESSKPTSSAVLYSNFELDMWN